ncbi:MAG: beta-3-deoxy-D-manno-oct-2-ulosonic acid transferase [Rhodobacterales bacterium]|nr:MAG: beta-3-deoxy-D-manno-oct-2-ulosonic acid transferase [Rhodobacterales bacterium]
MPRQNSETAAPDSKPGRFCICEGSLPLTPRIKRILKLCGHDPSQTTDPPDPLHLHAALLQLDHPLGLLIDHSAAPFDPSQPSDLETLLARHPLDDTALMNRAKTAMARLKAADISQMNTHDRTLPAPDPGYVLVLDQPRNHATVLASGANRASFQEMLVFAQEEHPGMRVLIRPPDGQQPGYFSEADCNQRIALLTELISPNALFEGAVGVYTIASDLGFDAIMAGHKPRVFGKPFYAGWGLSLDENPVDRRQRSLTRAQLFAAAMILYPKWYDPYRDQLCQIEEVIDALIAQIRSRDQDRHGYVAVGMKRWKRRFLRDFFGSGAGLRFQNAPDKAARQAEQSGAKIMLWATQEAGELADQRVLRVEDGFLRSNGLGANLTPPLSLITDDLGIYYDPSRASRLERLIADSVDLPAHDIHRAERLIDSLKSSKLSKYNWGSRDVPPLGAGLRILVPGQVEDDASIQKGCVDIRDNLGLLQHCRAQNPEAFIIYKPHPDVEAGLRPGAIEAAQYADIVAKNCDPIALIDAVDRVWTLTSLLGFEALLRGKQVTCLGVPFYAGWGLTSDLAPVPPRRMARPTLTQLTHASLIDYPRYYDPITRLPCPVEVVVERLQHHQLPAPGMGLRLLAKLQQQFARYAHLWR